LIAHGVGFPVAGRPVHPCRHPAGSRGFLFCHSASLTVVTISLMTTAGDLDETRGPDGRPSAPPWPVPSPPGHPWPAAQAPRTARPSASGSGGNVNLGGVFGGRGYDSAVTKGLHGRPTGIPRPRSTTDSTGPLLGPRSAPSRNNPQWGLPLGGRRQPPSPRLDKAGPSCSTTNPGGPR